MSAGACAHAFAFLNQRTGDPIWLDRAKLLASYYWERRNPETDLFADRPNAGANRFDGSHFVTSDTGLYCHALLKCHELTGEALFRDQALAYLKAYRKHGYDPATGMAKLFQSALGNKDFIWVMMIEVAVGVMVAFYLRAGVIAAFSEWEFTILTPATSKEPIR